MIKMIHRMALMLFCIGIASLTSGCVHIIAGAVQRSSETDNATYEEISRRSPLSAENSRVWLYMPSGGPRGMNPQGDRQEITFNRGVYYVDGETFYHRDMPNGIYRVTVGDVSQGNVFNYSVGPGKYQRQVSIKSAKEYFIRIQGAKANPLPEGGQLSFVTRPKSDGITFEFVPASEAIAEMRSLNHWIGPQGGPADPKRWREESK